MKKEEENPACSHYKIGGHDDAHCWKLHPIVRPKRFGGKGEKNTLSIMQ